MTATNSFPIPNNDNFISSLLRKVKTIGDDVFTNAHTAHSSGWDIKGVEIQKFYENSKIEISTFGTTQLQANESQFNHSSHLSSLFIESLGVMQIQTLNCNLDFEVIRFCRKMDFFESLYQVINILEKNFTYIKKLQINLDNDPESDDIWLAINFTSKGDTESILAQYDKYTEEVVSQVPMNKLTFFRTAFDLE